MPLVAGYLNPLWTNLQDRENATQDPMADAHLTDVSFTNLHLPETLARGIADAGFERCTPIQAQTLPRALAGFDVAGQAQTGTGKTAAFLVAMYSKLLRAEVPPTRKVNAPLALIIAPTRELAVQIHHDAEILGQYTGLRLGLAFGGVDYDKQRRELEEGVDVLIGTPGRLIDFYKQHVVELRSVQVLILDEADRMFDLGFIADIRYIMRRLPPPDQRLNLLFSATLAQRVLELAYEHMNDPELVRIEPDKMTVDRVRQCIYFPSMEEKPRLLVGLLRSMDPHRTMIFVNTRRGAEELEGLLRANGFNAEAISGDVPQRKRLRMLQDFHSGELAILIGTDVASRGLHIPDVSHVFNYDMPQDPEDYVHRIGRTARAGAEGDAISLGCEDYVQSLPDIEAYIGRSLPRAAMSEDLLAEITVPARERRRFAPGGRGPHGGRGGDRGRGGGGRDGRRGPPRERRDAGRDRPRPAPCPEIDMLGVPCFRKDSIPIFVLVTDAAFHNGPLAVNNYDPAVVGGTKSYADTSAALNAISAKIVGVPVNTGTPGAARKDLGDLAEKTGSKYHDPQFGGTDRALVSETDVTSGGVSGEVVRLLGLLSGAGLHDVTTARSNYSCAGGVDCTGDGKPDLAYQNPPVMEGGAPFDAAKLIKAVVPVESAAIPEPYGSLDPTTFFAVRGAAELSFRVHAQNDVWAPDTLQVLRAKILVQTPSGQLLGGAQGVKLVYFVIPEHIPVAK